MTEPSKCPLAALLPVALLAAALLAGCGGPGDGGAVDAGGEGAAATAGSSGDAPLPVADWDREVQVYFELPDFQLTDQHGDEYGSQQLEGKVWIANFIFTTCRAICPAMTARMTDLQAELFNHPRWRDLRLVSFSVDPENDTPEVLRDYAVERAYAYQDRWRFLTGTRDELWQLCKEGFKLAVSEGGDDPEMPIVHSDKFVLVDSEGRIRGFYSALSEEGREELLRDLEVVLAETPETPAPHAATVADEDLPEVPFPDDAHDPDWLEPRRQAQLDAADEIGVFHDFAFTDRLEESGIRFLNRVVDDAGIDYIGVHYDHGNGVAVADVDVDGFLDLYFTTQLGRNQLWRNLGPGADGVARFEDVTLDAGVDLGERISVTASFADVDNDGDPDLYVTTVRDGNVLFENAGAGRFRDVTESAGLGYSGHSSAGTFFDYDGDGLLDLFLANVGQYTGDERGRGGYYVGFPDAFAGHVKPERTEYSILYRNLGDLRFQDVTAETRLLDESWSGDATPVDLDRDGDQDLYLLDMQGHDEYYENVDGRSFEKRSREVFPNTPWGSMSIKFFDYDHDGRMDLILSDMHSDMSEKVGVEREKEKAQIRWPESVLRSEGLSIWGNALFHNLGEERFEEVSDQMGTENYWPWGLSVGDLNADGWEDVFIASSMNYPWRYQVNTVLLNDRGEVFRDSELVLGVEPRKDGRTVTPWFVLDCDGDLSGHLLHPEICEGREGKVEVQGALGSRSSVLFDLEDDGDLDVVTNDFNSEPMVLVSDLSERTDLHHLKVELVGTESNRDGLGARVTVTDGAGRKLVQVNDGKSGYLSQSSYPLYFGLGDAGEVESIEVLWPSGRTQTVDGPIEVNTVRTITEE